MYNFCNYLYCYFEAQISLSGPKVHLFTLSLLLMFNILEDSEFTFKLYDLENENGSGFEFDICDFCL